MMQAVRQWRQVELCWRQVFELPPTKHVFANTRLVANLGTAQTMQRVYSKLGRENQSIQMSSYLHSLKTKLQYTTTKPMDLSNILE